MAAATRPAGPLSVVVTVNGPGEIAGWLRPVADAAARLSPHIALTAVVTPCQFASGREYEVLRTIAGLTRVERFGRCLVRAAGARLALRRRRLADLVLHLGGDPVVTLSLARLIGAPAWIYGTATRHRQSFDRCLVPDVRTAVKLQDRGVDPNRIAVVGQLVADTVDAPESRRAEASVEPTLAFLPGSRDARVEFFVPYYAEVAERVSRAGCRVRHVLLTSAFVRRETVAQALTSAGWRVTAGDRWHASSPAGTRVEIRSEGVSDLGPDDLAVTIPGTITLQLAARGVPHVVIVPMQRSDLVLLDGPAGIMLPRRGLFGFFRRAVVNAVLNRRPYLAIPNIIASEAVVPELRGRGRGGRVDPSEVADHVLALLASQDRRRDMAAALTRLTGPRGAGRRVVEAMLDVDLRTCASAS